MNIFLPGTDQQLRSLLNFLNLNNCSILVMGSGSESIAGELRDKYLSSVIVIVDDSESLLISRIRLAAENNITVRLMDFAATDFKDSTFDLVYAQASISNNSRNKITKEVKRILKPGGYFCSGEIISLAENLPKFITDMFESSDILPLPADKINDFYSNRGFAEVLEKDLSFTLKDFYEKSISMLRETETSLDEREKSFYKKLIKKISHESNIYLKLGGEKYYGFKMLLLRIL